MNGAPFSGPGLIVGDFTIGSVPKLTAFGPQGPVYTMTAVAPLANPSFTGITNIQKINIANGVLQSNDAGDLVYGNGAGTFFHDGGFDTAGHGRFQSGLDGTPLGQYGPSSGSFTQLYTQSPDGSRWQIKVANDGTVSTVKG